MSACCTRWPATLRGGEAAQADDADGPARRTRGVSDLAGKRAAPGDDRHRAGRSEPACAQPS